MSDPDRVSLAFIWDTDSPHFSRRTFMRTMAFASAAGFVAACGSSSKSGVRSSGSINFSAVKLTGQSPVWRHSRA